jgi:hypothetical protein
VEGGAAAATLFRVGDGFSGGVVVVAELFLAKARACAAMAVGEDVAALVLFGCFGGVLHLVPPHGVLFLRKVFRTGEMSLDFGLFCSS